LYVDDSTTSVDDEKTAFEFYETSKKYLIPADFELPNGTPITLMLEKRSINTKPQDEIHLTRNSRMVSLAESLSVTKRSILRISAMFFDSLGLISPIVLQFKLLFKR